MAASDLAVFIDSKKLFKLPRTDVTPDLSRFINEDSFFMQVIFQHGNVRKYPSFIIVKPSIYWKTTDIESRRASPPANKQNGLCVQGEQHCQFDRMALCGSTTACCVYASLRQTAGMCQPIDEWRWGYRSLWTSCITGLTCTTGLTCLRANSNSYKTFVSCRQFYLALMKKKAARELRNTDSFLWHPACSAEWISVRSSRLYLSVLFCWSDRRADILPAQAVLSLSPSSLRHRLYLRNFSADTHPQADSAFSSHLR